MAERLKYCSIDPGKTTGYALFAENGDIQEFSKIKDPDKFLDWLEELDPFPEVFIIEQFRVRPFAGGNTWSTGPTQQLIGAIRRVLKKKGIPTKNVIFQEPSILPIGFKYAGLPYNKKKHVPDDQSALVHGIYYLTKNKIRKHRLEK